MSWVPPETFQFVTFTSNDNKDAEYTCICYKIHVKWSVSVLRILLNTLRKHFTTEIYIFCMVDSEILRFLLFLSLCDFCLFTSTHKHTGGEYVKNGQNFPLVGPTHAWCTRAHNLLLNAQYYCKTSKLYHTQQRTCIPSSCTLKFSACVSSL